MKIAERIVMVLLVLILVGGGTWFYFAVQHKDQEVRDAVARGEFEIKVVDKAATSSDQSNWREYYPDVVTMMIGSTTVAASVADTLPERIKGLSDTPYLPENVVKLFAFGSLGDHSIWMKDMNYALDILWATEDGTIVHIEENVSPDTYPTSFSSPTPSWYVVETNAGFVATHAIKRGDKIIVPQP